MVFICSQKIFVSSVLWCIPGLLDRLRSGESVVCAEGYLFAFERRGYLKAGAFVPEVVLEHPELVRQQYEEFVHAGSDVVLAFTVNNINYDQYKLTNKPVSLTGY